LLLATTVVHHGNCTGAVHRHQITRLRTDGRQVDEAHNAVVLGIKVRLLRDTRCRTTDVEGTHRELGARLADGLRSDDADSFAEFHGAAGGQVAAIAADANTALGFAGQHGTDLYPLNAGRLDRGGEVLVDLLVD